MGDVTPATATHIWHRYSAPYLDIFFEIAPTGDFQDRVFRAQCTYSAEDDHGLVTDAEWTYSECSDAVFEELSIVPPAVKELFISNIPQITAAFVAWRLGESPHDVQT